ncbi:NAD(P)/FAD-dependent oxidoreductase [Bosea sp. 2RAB26]|uniref:NAD(P)/FAD-dependent oxidoreductase n=1 Tax=Bosea sp. 2RAB26 TaxID=3237476 RepID=UPI003F932571
MPEIIVVGAGVLGTSVAYRLALAGARVTVLEATRVGGGTSGISFAWTNSCNKEPRSYHDLNVAGMKAHAALKEEFGATPWWHGGGRVEWKAEAERDGQRTKVSRLQDWRYAAEWIDRKQLLELEPDIDPAAIGDAPIAWYPNDGWLDPVVYAHAMMSAACRLGAELKTQTRVRALLVEGGKVKGVRCETGEIFHADLVVNCTGRWSNDTIGTSAPNVPLEPTVGFLVFTPAVPASIQRVVSSPLCDFRPDGAGRLMVHWGPADAQVTPEVSEHPGMAQAAVVIERLTRILPGIAPIQPEATRVTQRPIPRDGLSAIGPVPGLDGYYLMVTHSGATLSPALGAMAADEILTGIERQELADFRPARFFT